MDKVQIVLPEVAYGHQIEVIFTKVTTGILIDEVPCCLKNHIECELDIMDLNGTYSGEFNMREQTPNTDGESIYYAGTWRVVPALDHEFMVRIALWLNNYAEGEGLTRQLFHETYGTVMGDHYIIKWESVYHLNLIKMIAYFGLNSDDGCKFSGMVMQQMAKYEKRIEPKRNG